MEISFSETQGWWVNLNSDELLKAVMNFLSSQGCEIHNGPDSIYVGAADSEGYNKSFDLKRVSLMIPVKNGSVTFRGDIGPGEHGVRGYALKENQTG